jgi:hypothetical protein
MIEIVISDAATTISLETGFMQAMLDEAVLERCPGLGFVLWLIGCALGVALFLVVPPSWIGWLITPTRKNASYW